MAASWRVTGDPESVRQIVLRAMVRIPEEFRQGDIEIRVDWDGWYIVYVDGQSHLDVCAASKFDNVHALSFLARPRLPMRADTEEEWFDVLLSLLDPLVQLAVVKHADCCA